MWTTDLMVSKWKGAIQGWHQGMYSNSSWTLPASCLDRQVVRQLFYFQLILQHLDVTNALTIFQIAYNIYYNVLNMCQMEHYLYDLSEFCFDNDCTFERLMQNELGKVF